METCYSTGQFNYQQNNKGMSFKFICGYTVILVANMQSNLKFTHFLLLTILTLWKYCIIIVANISYILKWEVKIKHRA